MEIFRRNRRSIASHVLALLAVVWLNLALAPCAMSMPMQMSGGAAPCIHCQPGQSHCDTGSSSQCALQAQVADDSALLNLSLDHHFPNLGTAPVVVQFIPRPNLQAFNRRADRLPSAAGIALHKRFCVYLK